MKNQSHSYILYCTVMYCIVFSLCPTSNNSHLWAMGMGHYCTCFYLKLLASLVTFTWFLGILDIVSLIACNVLYLSINKPLPTIKLIFLHYVMEFNPMGTEGGFFYIYLKKKIHCLFNWGKGEYVRVLNKRRVKGDWDSWRPEIPALRLSF